MALLLTALAAPANLAKFKPDTVLLVSNLPSFDVILVKPASNPKVTSV